MELAEDTLALAINQLEGVWSVTMHESVTVRNASVSKEEQQLVRRFRSERDKVPEHVRVLKMRNGIPLGRMNETREKNRVTYEEDRSVVAHHVPVALFRVKFDGKTTRISYSVGWTILTSHCRKADSDWCLFTNRRKYFGSAILRYVVRYLKVTESTWAHPIILVSLSSASLEQIITGPLCVDDSFWDPFPVKMSQFVNQNMVR